MRTAREIVEMLSVRGFARGKKTENRNNPIPAIRT